MIAYHYLLFSAGLNCNGLAPSCVKHLAAGRFSDALSTAAALESSFHDPIDCARLKQFCADLHLLKGATEEAEDTYRISLKQLPLSQDAEALSCRAAGFLALFQRRFETAASCFEKILKLNCSKIIQLEAQIHFAQILYEAGLKSRASNLLSAAATKAYDNSLLTWQQLAIVMMHDISVREAIQNQIEMRDDIYWQSFGPTASATDSLAPYNASDCLSVPIKSLLDQRMLQLNCIMALSRGENCEGFLLQTVLGSTKVLSPQCHQTTVIELTQASITGRLIHLAEILIVGGATSYASIRNSHPPECHDPQHRQLTHCYAKLKLLQGMVDDGLAIYSHYALLAMQAMRSNYPIAQRFDEKPPSDYSVVKDHISARLPARYRRAYQYMLAHAHLPTLTINDVANVIGVSERALQLAFKEHIGLTPREVLRRHRMQNIRADLQEAGGIGVMEVAIKHGIKNRTALTAGYRRYYNETPSKTSMG